MLKYTSFPLSLFTFTLLFFANFAIAKGSEPTQISPISDISSSEISPDGKSIIYVTRNEVDCSELYITYLDGSGTRKLDHQQTTQDCRLDDNSYQERFYISPDSKNVLYVLAPVLKPIEFWLVSLPTSMEEEIERKPMFIKESGRSFDDWGSTIKFTPDSSTIILNIPSGSDTLTNAIFSLNVKGTPKLKRLMVYKDGEVKSFSISTDSRRIIYLADPAKYASAGRLYSISIDGSRNQPLTPLPSHNVEDPGEGGPQCIVVSFVVTEDNSHVVYSAMCGVPLDESVVPRAQLFSKDLSCTLNSTPDCDTAHGVLLADNLWKFEYTSLYIPYFVSPNSKNVVFARNAEESGRVTIYSTDVNGKGSEREIAEDVVLPMIPSYLSKPIDFGFQNGFLIFDALDGGLTVVDTQNKISQTKIISEDGWVATGCEFISEDSIVCTGFIPDTQGTQDAAAGIRVVHYNDDQGQGTLTFGPLFLSLDSNLPDLGLRGWHSLPRSKVLLFEKEAGQTEDNSRSSFWVVVWP